MLFEKSGRVGEQKQWRSKEREGAPFSLDLSSLFAFFFGAAAAGGRFAFFLSSRFVSLLLSSLLFSEEIAHCDQERTQARRGGARKASKAQIEELFGPPRWKTCGSDRSGQKKKSRVALRRR